MGVAVDSTWYISGGWSTMTLDGVLLAEYGHGAVDDDGCDDDDSIDMSDSPAHDSMVDVLASNASSTFSHSAMSLVGCETPFTSSSSSSWSSWSSSSTEITGMQVDGATLVDLDLDFDLDLDLGVFVVVAVDLLREILSALRELLGCCRWSAPVASSFDSRKASNPGSNGVSL